MPEIPFQHKFIDEPIRPTTIDGVLFQRTIRYITHAPYQDPDTGNMSLVLSVQVRHFHTAEDGTVGDQAFGLVPSRLAHFRTDNNEVLDATTGQIVLSRTDEKPEQWQALLDADPRPLIGRGNAYEAMLHSGPVDMVPQLRAAMQAADAAPYYRFGGAPEPEADPE